MGTEKKNKSNNKLIAVFAFTFLAVLIIVPYLAQRYSPSVDVEIGSEGEDYDNQEENGLKKLIDNRLKWIQFEDNMPGASKKYAEGREENSDINYMDEQQLSDKEKVKRYKNGGEETEKSIVKGKEEPIREEPKILAPVPIVHAEAGTAKPAAETANRPVKIYVGNYSTIEQAIAAQNKLMESDVNVTPFVKEVNGSYVLQVGSFANKQKAEELTREIINAGMSARMVQE